MVLAYVRRKRLMFLTHNKCLIFFLNSVFKFSQAVRWESSLTLFLYILLLQGKHFVVLKYTRESTLAKDSVFQVSSWSVKNCRHIFFKFKLLPVIYWEKKLNRFTLIIINQQFSQWGKTVFTNIFTQLLKVHFSNSNAFIFEYFDQNFTPKTNKQTNEQKANQKIKN